MGISLGSGLHPGQVFAGRYRIVRVIKEGGMGAIHEVRHHETEGTLALKVMLPGKENDVALRERFRLEAKLTANIRGEHIVRAFDAGFDEETKTPFLVMERLEGEDLGTRIARDGPLPPDQVVALLEQLARALERIHAAGVVHRDIKPSNLFVTRRDDGSPLLKVLDFGVAKVVVETTKTVDPTLVVGSPPYMPPEQLAGEGDIGTAADLYAFAHVAFALLVGSAYWSDEHQREGLRGLRRMVNQGLPEPASARARRRGASLPPEFDEWFRRATAVDADDRPASPIEMASGLAGALGVQTGAATPSVKVTPWLLGLPRRSMLLGLIVVPSIAAGWLAVRTARQEEAPRVAPQPSNAVVQSAEPGPSASAPAGPTVATVAPQAVTSARPVALAGAAPRKAASARPRASAPATAAPSPPSDAGPVKSPDPFGDGVQ